MDDHATPPQSLAGRYYTDPEIFRLEQSGLLARTWQMACHASEVANPGDYHVFELAGESLFVVRGRDDIVRCFYNVCQ